MERQQGVNGQGKIKDTSVRWIIDRARSQRNWDDMDSRAQMERLILVREGKDFFLWEREERSEDKWRYREILSYRGKKLKD